MKKYTFHLCQTHPTHSIKGWYLELWPDDSETVMKVYCGIVSFYFTKYGMNPHIKPDSVEGQFYNPIKLAAGWLQSVERYLLAGIPVLINPYGGLLPKSATIILETVESENIRWHIRFEHEIITIRHWPGGKHYYLCSSEERIFVPDKYNTFLAATEEALHYVPADRIRSQI